MSSPSPVPGSRPSLEELFAEHREGLCGAIGAVLGRRAEVQEVLQEAFVKAFKAERSGRALEDRVAWLFVVVLNTARDAVRRESRRRAALPRAEENAVSWNDLPTRDPPPLERAARQEWLAAARAAIHRLSDPEKDVFLLKVAAESPFSAVSRALQIPEGTAKTRMRAALAKLRQSLAGYAPEEKSRSKLSRSTEDLR